MKNSRLILFWYTCFVAAACFLDAITTYWLLQKDNVIELNPFLPGNDLGSITAFSVIIFLGATVYTYSVIKKVSRLEESQIPDDTLTLLKRTFSRQQDRRLASLYLDFPLPMEIVVLKIFAAVSNFSLLTFGMSAPMLHPSALSALPDEFANGVALTLNVTIYSLIFLPLSYYLTRPAAHYLVRGQQLVADGNSTMDQDDKKPTTTETAEKIKKGKAYRALAILGTAILAIFGM